MKKTKKERRIEVIKDALLQLKRESLIASPGVVCSIDELAQDTDKFDKELTDKYLLDLDLQKFLKTKLKTKKHVCNVCARGALLISTIHKENTFSALDLVSVGGSYDEDSVTDQRLSKLFSGQQLALMETAFEVEDTLEDQRNYEEHGDEFGDDQKVLYALNSALFKHTLVIKAVDFGMKYENPQERLIAIFKNMIKNEGIFKP